MKKIVLVFLGIVVSIFSLFLLSHTVKKAFAQENFTIQKGQVETVFDWSSQKCNEEDIPDTTPQFFIDAEGNVQLIATHYTARRSIGSNLDEVQHKCDVIFNSHYNPVPRMYDDYEWLHSSYTLDGRTIYNIVHTEYQGWNHNNCQSSSVFDCWWNSLNLAISSDGGAHYFHSPPPTHNIANSPIDYNPSNTFGNIGFFNPSNIIFKDGYYYSLVREHNPPRGWGNCIMRTNNLADPKSWRFWDGSGFNIRPDGAESLRCQQIFSLPHVHLSYNTYLGKYLAISSWWDGALFATYSDDLIHWTQPREILRIEGPYPALIQPGDSTRNFEQTGRSPWLYFMKPNGGLDRDLVRVRIRFDKPGEENKYPVLDLQMNEKKGNKTLDSSFFTNDGTLQGGVSFGFENNRNYLHFDGNGQVVINNNSSLNTANQITIEAAIRTSVSPPADTYPTIIRKESGGLRNYGFYLAPQGVLHFSLTKGNAQSGSVGTRKVNDGQWHHVMLIYDNNTGIASYYVDEELDVQRYHGAKLEEGINSSSVIIGDQGFTGDIDSVTLLNFMKVLPSPVFNLKKDWNQIIWPDVLGKKASDIPTECPIAVSKENFWFKPHVKNFGGVNFNLEKDKTYFIKCNQEATWNL